MTIGTPTTLGSGTGQTSNKTTITTTATVPAGNLVVVAAVQNGGSVVVSSVSDGTNSYAQAESQKYNTSSTDDVELWFFLYSSTLASGSTLTITWSGTPTGAAAVAAQVSGITSSSPYDSAAGNTNNGSSTAPSVADSSSLVQASEIQFGALGWTSSSASNYTENSPFTNLYNNVVNNSARISLGYDIVSATTAVTYAPTLSTSRPWGAIISPFKGAPASATTPFSFQPTKPLLEKVSEFWPLVGAFTSAAPLTPPSFPFEDRSFIRGKGDDWRSTFPNVARAATYQPPSFQETKPPLELVSEPWPLVGAFTSVAPPSIPISFPFLEQPPVRLIAKTADWMETLPQVTVGVAGLQIAGFLEKTSIAGRVSEPWSLSHTFPSAGPIVPLPFPFADSFPALKRASEFWLTFFATPLTLYRAGPFFETPRRQPPPGQFAFTPAKLIPPTPSTGDNTYQDWFVYQTPRPIQIVVDPNWGMTLGTTVSKPITVRAVLPQWRFLG